MNMADTLWRVDVRSTEQRKAPSEGYLLVKAETKYLAMRRCADHGLHVVGATPANGTDVWPRTPELAARFDKRNG